MIEKEIELYGKKFYKVKTIIEKGTMYVEYRNNEIQRSKFFEVKSGKRVEVEDTEKLKEVIKNNYELNED